MSDGAIVQECEEKGPLIVVSAEECFNYAAWQNSVPLLRSVIVKNTTNNELSSITVEFEVTPAFARPKRWRVDRVSAGQQVALRDIDIEVDIEYLDRLDEAIRGVLSFRLLKDDQALVEMTSPVRILARDEWGGMGSMGKLLPAFVTPNDPAVMPLLKSAAEVLGRHGHSTALDGYQTGDPNRSYMLTAALWSAVAAKSLTYANPPSSFERVGQKTRRVSTVLGEGLATCLDTTLLFASGLEAMGLNPVLVMTEGHCFAGVWLIKKTLKKLNEPDCSELRKAIVARELIVFETTLVTHRPAATFAEAISAAEAALTESREYEFVAAVDVARARMSQVRPLASHGERPCGEEAGVETSPPALPATPGYERLAVEEQDSNPQTPAGRIERWQRKLLDLSLRNRLLNFRATKQTIPVLCPNISRLEDRVADGARMRLVSLKEETMVGDRDATLHQQRTRKDLDLEFAREALERDEVACPVESRDLDTRLTALYRKVKNDLAEGGSNTLYLAIGFLKWKQNTTDEKTYRAPLLLVPVKLLRRSVSSPFYLARHEDEVRFNATLLQLLKKDFDCDLTAMESSLPTDDSGVDVPKVLERMRRAVRDIPGFEVVEDVAVATFSFSKYLMWKDLVERVAQLDRNRVVRHLINEPDKPFSSDGAGPLPRPHEIDTRYTPSDIVHPLPADSSQLSAVMAAAEGHDLVIVGPPGTGKSQTIANLIAQCLAVGKTVLFVAEKTAALDVVHRRLREHGLGDCCIELHSNKAERRRLLDQLEASWNRRACPDGREWVDVSERLRVRRDELNAYVAAVHAKHPNSWTAYRAMGLCVRERKTPAPKLTWPRTVTHDRQAYELVRKSVNELAFAYGALPRDADLGRLEAREWSMAWESDFLASCRRLKEASESLASGIKQLSTSLNLPLPDDISSAQLSVLYRLANELTRSQLPWESLLLHEKIDDLKNSLNVRRGLLERRQRASAALSDALSYFAAALGAPPSEEIPEPKRTSYYRLANELTKPDPPPAALVFHPTLEDLPEQLTKRSELLKRTNEAWEAIAARHFNPTLVKQIKLSEVESAWTKAANSFWPMSTLRKRSVQKKLNRYMKVDGVAEPDIDIPLLREYQDFQDALSENLGSLALPGDLQSTVEKTPAKLRPLIEAARRLRNALTATGHAPLRVGEVTQNSIEPLVSAARLLYPPGREIEILKSELRENLATLGIPPELQVEVEDSAGALDAQIEAAERLRNAAASLGIPIEALAKLVTSLTAEGRNATAHWCHCARTFQGAWREYSKFAEVTPVASESTSIIGDAAAQVECVVGGRTLLKRWTVWVAARRQAEALGLTAFVDALQRGELPVECVSERFELAYARWWLPAAVDRSDKLRTFQRFRHEDAVDDFRKLDELARKAAAPRALQAMYHDLPRGDQVPRKSELGLLRHQMGLKRPSKSIREVITGMPESFGKLAPCLLMSPLSIAQYLPTDQAPFDVVVFDEASQIPTWDAIGAIARGKQTIIVGDPKQLPPTNFFGRADSDEEDDELDDYEKDLESILDEVKASGLPTLQLNWHYRSRHESLIAFSNYHYYGNNLVTFPAAESEDRGVSLSLVKEGIYDRGKSRTNRAEAEAIVSDAVSRMRRCLAKPEKERRTYGVVTFNSHQQALIQDFFDQALRDTPDLEWFFNDERIEPTAVKNLENVQGDERDVMYFSITFGKDSAGKFPVDFGAINRDGGERRLNVAVTRARQALFVYASFLPDELRAERTSARGVRDLKAFLEYAQKGPEVIAARIDGSVGDIESPFEQAVADALESLGWLLDPQVGVSGFRVDLGVIHPDCPGAYLAGVECDGATYHRSAAARDRDKTRQQVLENLGWKILRVWSPDWWYDSDSAITDLHNRLNELLAESRKRVDEASSADPTERRDDEVPEICLAEADLRTEELTPNTKFSVTSQPADNDDVLAPQLIGKCANVDVKEVIYRLADLGDATEEQIRFFDDDYSRELRQLALTVVEVEGPVRDDVVARRIARAHGFARTGARIKDRVLSLLPEVTATNEDVGRFLWATEIPRDTVPFRRTTPGDERRSLDEVSMPELVGLVLSRPDLAVSEDAALAFAREVGLARLAKSARDRIERAVVLARAMSNRPQ